jgi:phage gp36-like protein
VYVSQQDLVDRFGTELLEQLTDRDGTAGGIVAATVDAAIVDAVALVDGYLAGRYQLPLPAVPPLVAGTAAAITLYRLYQEAAPEKVRADHDQALRVLRDIADGKVKLPLPAPATGEPAGHGDGILFEGGGRMLDREALRGW